MSARSDIEWLRGADGSRGSTWNAVTGCVEMSSGCDNCYAKTMAERFRGVPGHYFENGFDVTLRPDKLAEPLGWRKARKVFVNSMSDVFHPKVPAAYVAAMWTVMFWTSRNGRPGRPNHVTKPRHTYLLLTKRAARMRDWVRGWADSEQRVAWIREAAEKGWCDAEDIEYAPQMDAVLPNLWLGVSVENQAEANRRIDALLATPAAVRWLSIEPLLAPIDLVGPLVNGHRPRLTYWLTGRPGWGNEHATPTGLVMQEPVIGTRIDWVVVGGESGRNRNVRPMHPQWARDLRDQCADAGVPFFFKQWGEWGPAPWRVDREAGESVEDYKARAEATCATHAYAVWADQYGHDLYEPPHKPWSVERTTLDDPWQAAMRRWGKAKAGHLLDGREHLEYPPCRE